MRSWKKYDKQISSPFLPTCTSIFANFPGDARLLVWYIRYQKVGSLNRTYLVSLYSMVIREITEFTLGMEEGDRIDFRRARFFTPGMGLGFYQPSGAFSQHIFPSFQGVWGTLFFNLKIHNYILRSALKGAEGGRFKFWRQLGAIYLSISSQPRTKILSVP